FRLLRVMPEPDDACSVSVMIDPETCVIAPPALSDTECPGAWGVRLLERLMSPAADRVTSPLTERGEPNVPLVFKEPPVTETLRSPGALTSPMVRLPPVSVMEKSLSVPTNTGLNTPPLKSFAVIE